MKFGVLYDLRNAPDPKWFTPWPEFYAGALEHMEEMDRLGFEVLGFAEHHGDPTGYNPAIGVALTAAALRTKRARIGTNIVQLPFHHPVLLAEELAVIDVISNGRLDVGAGLVGGSFDMEFRMLGINPKHRPSLGEEAIEIIRRAWTEDEPFSFHGKRYHVEDVWINPKPVQKPHPPIFLPAPQSEAGLDRIARLGVNAGAIGGFFLGLTNKMLWESWHRGWVEAAQRNGRDPDDVHISTFATCYVTDDPERDWAEYREGHLYHFNYERQGVHPYSSLFLPELPQKPEDLPGWQGVFQTAEDAIKELRDAFGDAAPDEVQLMATRPGMSWEKSAEYMRNFAEKVIPHVKDLGRSKAAAGT